MSLALIWLGWSRQVKMRWDDACLYVGAYLEEPQAWANLVRASSADYVAPSQMGCFNYVALSQRGG
jgi:hypothetical protein